MKLNWKKANKTLLLIFLVGALPIHAADQDAAVYEVDSDVSRADILVFRGGNLARFGHDHVISTTAINGSVTVSPTFQDSKAELTVLLDTLEVDREDLRDKYGMDTQLSRSAKMGTRKNMLDKVLHATDWPQVSISAAVITADTLEPVLNVRFTLHGIQQKFTLPVYLRINGDQLHVAGTFGLRQTDYGLEPFSRMGGALRIKDSIQIHFDLTAKRRLAKTADIREAASSE